MWLMYSNFKNCRRKREMATINIAGTLFILFTILISSAVTIKLNVPRVLLPYSQTVAANFSLEVTGGGCFSWHNSRPEVIKIHVVDEEGRGCSEKAVVSSTSRVSSLQNALVTLVNDANGESFHFDVTVASVHSLEITTTTKELLLEDTPEAMSLVAKDSEGDTFSSLDGLHFDWTPVTDAEGISYDEEVVEAHDILRFMKFTESSYKASPSIYALESQGKRGYKLLVQGIKTGTAKLKATLRDTAYPQSLSAEIGLAVVANVVLQPSYEVRLLVGSVIAYQVMLIQQGKAQRIPMPSEQFYLTVSDETVGQLDPRTSEVEGLTVGYTTIVLKDRNVKAKQVFRQPIAGIHVVQPHHLGFVVVQHRNWFLTHGHDYTVLVKIYDRENNEVYHTDNIRISATFPDSHLTTLADTHNGTWFRLRAERVGKLVVTARLQGLLDQYGSLRTSSLTIEGSQEVEILERVTITPPLLVIPWNTITKPSFRFKFEAQGGGTYGYQWSSSDTTVSTCGSTGEIQTKRDGAVNITVSSVRNRRNQATATVRIVLPDVLEILESVVEVEVGTVLHLPLALRVAGTTGAAPTVFTECTQYSFKVDVADPDKLEYAPDDFAAPNVPGSCASLPLLAKSVGVTRVHARAQGRDGEIASQATVAVYRPLTVITPTDSEVVLTAGSYAKVVFQGGPRPWPLYPQGHFRKVAVTNATVLTATIEDFDPSDLHLVTVLCTELGETTLNLLVGNQHSGTNPSPVTAKAQIRVVCAVPAVMELHPQVRRPAQTPGRPACLAGERRVIAHCYRDLEITVTMRDERGRVFDNFTSLAVSWESSDVSLVSFSGFAQMALVVEENVFDGYRTVNRSFQIVHPQGVEGSVKVTATATSYRNDLPRLGRSSVRAGEPLDSKIVAFVYLDLVDDALFEQDTLSVFNHPQNKASLLVLKGSGQFDFEPKEQTVASVTYDATRRGFQLSPKTEGRFVLELYDVCLESRRRATVAIRVSGIGQVDARMTDKVGLDREIIAHVQVLDHEGGQLPASVFSLLDVRAQHFSSIVSVRALAADNTPTFRFAVKGNLLGHTTLTFTVGPKVAVAAAEDIPTRSSEPQPIQVFSPLRLHPRNVTLIVGASIQLSSSGGPSPEAGLDYIIADSRTASVSNAGIVEGSAVGETVVTGRAVGGEGGGRIVHSEDRVSVNVVALSGVRIRVPVTRIRAGAILPVYAVGSDDERETPFAFGSAAPRLSFRWSISNNEVAALRPPFEECGVRLGVDNHFMTRLVAKQQGQVTLVVEVTAAAGADQIVPAGTVLRDEVHIQVFEPLVLIAPPVESEGVEITVTPHTDYKIRTNKDQGSRLTYHTFNSNCGPEAGDDLRVDGGGQLRTGSAFCGAHLAVSFEDESGTRSTLSAVVEVKPVAYLTVTPLCSLRSTDDDAPLAVLPVGTQTLFGVRFFDGVGKEFQATNSRLRFQPSRHDLIQVMQGPRNNTFLVKANDPGLTVLRIWDAENVGVEDFLLVATGEVILPASPVVTLGDVLCLHCPLSTGGQDAPPGGTWRSETPHVVRMVTNGGMAFAADVGTSVLSYSVAGLATSTRVTVLPIRQVSFQQGVGRVSNWQSGQLFRFPVFLRSDGRPAGTNLHGRNCSSLDQSSVTLPFQCELTFREQEVPVAISDVFDVDSRFNTKLGHHECVLTTRALSPAAIQQLSTVHALVELTVTVQRRSAQEPLRSETLTVPFDPAFFVHQTALTVSDAPSGQRGTACRLTVTASESAFRDLEVRANDTRTLTVSPPTPVTGDTRHYQVTLSDQFWMLTSEEELPVVHLEVSCPLSGKVVVVPVTLEIVGDSTGKCPTERERQGWGGLFQALAERYQLLLTVSLTVIATLIALYIGYHAIVGQKYYAAGPQTGVFLNRSGSGDGRMYPPGSLMSPSAERTHLWSVNEPTHGSPFNRSSSPVYRYNNNE